MKKLSKNTTLKEILKIPEAEKILAKYKLPCLWCPLIKIEARDLKLGQVCRMYNIEAEKMLKELNKKLKEKI